MNIQWHTWIKPFSLVLAGELAAKRGDHENAIARRHRAVLLEDNLIYNEPPDWPFPYANRWARCYWILEGPPRPNLSIGRT